MTDTIKPRSRAAKLASFFNDVTQYADKGAEIKLWLENPDGNGWGWTLGVHDAEFLERLCLEADRRTP
jgi:hypothetical protein